MLTGRRLPVILEEIAKGSRPPLDHACLTNDQWAEIKRIFLDVAACMRQAEAYFDDISRQAASPPPETDNPDTDNKDR